MKKKVIVLSFTLVLLSIGLIIFILFSFSASFFPSSNVITLKIENKTETDVDSLVITHTNSKSDITLPTVKANDGIEYDIDFSETATEEFSEGSMEIHYQGSNEILVGYIGRGYGGEVKVRINSINENGHIDFLIKSDVY